MPYSLIDVGWASYLDFASVSDLENLSLPSSCTWALYFPIPDPNTYGVASLTLLNDVFPDYYYY